MNIEKIAAIYELKDHEVKKIMKTAGFDHKKTELSRDEMQVFDEVWTLVVKDGKTHKDASDIMKQRAEQANNGAAKSLSPDENFTAKMNEFIDGIADEFAGEAPEVIEEQKELARQYMAQRFRDRLVYLANSGQMQKNFQKAMSAKNQSVIEAEVLPGEPSALPESSTSGT